MELLTTFVREGGELDRSQVQQAAALLMNDASGAEERVEFLKALATRGETAGELALFVESFLEMAVDPGLAGLSGPTIDVCGTGGDKLNLFNVSTTSMFVIAAGGATVVKHGNRGITSKSGGADVLEALGVRLDLPCDALRTCVEEAGVGFLFAQAYHPAFKAIMPVRKILAEQGQRTLFNLIGPLLNPARPHYQLVGVPDRKWTPLFADILERLGRKSAWVVSGTTADGRGVDEVSLMGPTHVSQSGTGVSTEDAVISPEEFGFEVVSPEDLVGAGADENALILKAILSGEDRGPKRQMVQLNAAAGLVCAGLSETMSDAVVKAGELIDSGEAMKRLETMVECSK